jgi:ParB-like chromosome segregation protein Spo0J
MKGFKAKTIRPMNPNELGVSPELNRVQTFMPISQDDRDRLRKDIQDTGEIRDPIKVYFDEEGTPLILGGKNRWEIAIELGFDFVPIEVYDLPGDKRRELALMDNLARRHLTREQKDRIVREFLRITPELSNNTLSKKVGVDDKTVGKIRREMESTSEIPKLKTRKGADGKVRTAKPVKKPVVVKKDSSSKKDATKKVYAKRDKRQESRLKNDIDDYLSDLAPTDVSQCVRDLKKYLDSKK